MKPAPPEIVLRSPAEVQWAHDLLKMLPECPGAVAIPAYVQVVALATSTALCWVLRHDDGAAVEALLRAAEATMKDGGHAGPKDQRPC